MPYRAVVWHGWEANLTELGLVAKDDLEPDEGIVPSRGTEEENKGDYEPGINVTMYLLLRRTLVRSVFLFTITAASSFVPEEQFMGNSKSAVFSSTFQRNVLCYPPTDHKSTRRSCRSASFIIELFPTHMAFRWNTFVDSTSFEDFCNITLKQTRTHFFMSRSMRNIELLTNTS